MFGRGRTYEPSARQQMGVRVHREVAVVADPDAASIKRVRALFHQTGRGMQGEAGRVVPYDQGDPERSLRGLVRVQLNPIDAHAAIGRATDASVLPPGEYNNTASAEIDRDPFLSAAFDRMRRRP